MPVLQHRGQDTNGSMKIRHKEAPITEDTGAWWVRGCGLSCGSRVCCWIAAGSASLVLLLSTCSDAYFTQFPRVLFSFAQETMSSLTSRLPNRAPPLPTHIPGDWFYFRLPSSLSLSLFLTLFLSLSLSLPSTTLSPKCSHVLSLGPYWLSLSTNNTSWLCSTFTVAFSSRFPVFFPLYRGLPKFFGGKLHFLKVAIIVFPIPYDLLWYNTALFPGGG